MTEHPITPSPELVEQWKAGLPTGVFDGYQFSQRETDLCIKAARWGADQELDACCEWIPKATPWDAEQLRAARRPKPPSLKQQALGALYAIATGADDTREFHQDLETIKQALESLPDV